MSVHTPRTTWSTMVQWMTTECMMTGDDINNWWRIIVCFFIVNKNKWILIKCASFGGWQTKEKIKQMIKSIFYQNVCWPYFSYLASTNISCE